MTKHAAAAAVVFVAACQSASALDNPPPAPPAPKLPAPTLLEHDLSVRYHMRNQYDLMRAIELMVVRGKLEEARPLARSIAQAPDVPSLEVWARHTMHVRNAAAAIAYANDIEEASRGIARVAAACAECHAAAGVMPQLAPPPDTPRDSPTVEARMARHRWAADRLWEGMVFAADEPWLTGLDMLAKPPLLEPEVMRRRVEYARHLQRIADDARLRSSTDTITDRARTYGEVLVTCTNCHTTPTPRVP